MSKQYRWRFGMMLALALVGLIVSPCVEAADEAKEEPKRPKVALVLGGGGALGLAHIGVLKVLEEAEIPIDYVVGTSMGAIIGGFYSAGMSPEEIEQLMCGIDWWDVLHDRSPRRFVEFRWKQDEQRHLFDIEVGLRDWGFVIQNGLAAGQKLNTLMETELSSAAIIPNFDHLNIPYRAVGTDLLTGTAHVMERGSLPTAMRASMAVPGAFTPVSIDDKLIADGGVVNNIPVDVARAMGADIIIAVDVGWSSTRAADADLSTILGILNRSYTIMQRPEQERQAATATVLIRPELADFDATMFHRVADIIPRGEEAARKQMDALKAYSDTAAFKEFLTRQRNREEPSGKIRTVKVQGCSMVDERQILARVDIEDGSPVDFDRIRGFVARIYGMGDFQNVSYRLQPTAAADEHDLEIMVREKQWGPGYMHFGLRLSSDLDKTAVWDALVNYRRRQLNALGGELDIDAQGGRTQGGTVEFFQPLDYGGNVFVMPWTSFKSQLRGSYNDGEKVADFEQDLLSFGFDTGVQLGSYGEIRCGIVHSDVEVTTRTGTEDMPLHDVNVTALTASFTIDRLDKVVLATEGYFLRASAFMARKTAAGDHKYDKADLSFAAYESYGDHTLFASGGGGASFGSDIPDYDEFYLGGSETLAGVQLDELRGDYYGYLQLGYRYRLTSLPPALGEGFYFLARADVGNAWKNKDDVDADDLIFGGLFGVAADTKFGPAFAGAGFAEDRQTSYYLALGTVF